jgi:tRNA(Ser,Leu) C12 N-acetylase TAN1
MAQVVEGLRDRILPGETWGMELDRHRYSRHHTSELVELLSRNIDVKVNLSHPDKIVRVDIIGMQAGIAVLRPGEIFSTHVRSDQPPGN